MLTAYTPMAVYASEDSVQGEEEQEDEEEEEEEETEEQKKQRLEKEKLKKQKEKQSEINESKEKPQDAQGERKDMQSALTNIKEQKQDMEVAKDKLSDVVEELDGQLMDVQDKISQLELLVAQKQLEISQIKVQLKEAEQTEKDQYAMMKQRIQFMYERGNTTYISLLLGAESLSDMLNKAAYIEEVYGYDRQMLEQYKQTAEEIKTLKETLEQEKKNLNNAQTEATEKEDEMSDLIVQKENQIKKYEGDISNKEQAIKDYEAEIAAQNAAIAAIEASIVKAEKELLELTVSENDAGEGQEIRKYSGGKFAWPAPSYTRISDDYGNRIHPTLGVQQFHNGVDMAAPNGSPIVAAADGTVVGAGYSGTMGNYIMINHGSGVFTVYMHASAIYVSTGTSVTRGQKIGAVGSTGRSTGPHLHFSVRVNGSYVSPWNYL